MTIEFTTANEESPVVEFEYPVDNLQVLFDNYKDWRTEDDTRGLEYKELDKRLTRKSNKIDNSNFTAFEQAIEESKLQLVEKFLTIDTKGRWPNIATSIARRINIYSVLITDLKGYSMNQHIDNRSVYAAGYLNIFDNESLTVISSTKKSFFGKETETQYHAPGKKGRGVIWLNTENSWHWVNKVSQDRKILMMSFQIVPWD
jgi:hypothetical protein